MALVHRNGRPYFYRSVRRGGRVTSEYMGGGIDAQLIAALEADEQDWKRFDREQARSERKELDDLERALDELAERARDRSREGLIAAGYHLHHRGERRKRRVSRPHEGERLRRIMDNLAVERLIDWAAGKKGNEKAKVALKEELCDLAANLAGPNPSSVETLAGRRGRDVVVRLQASRSSLCEQRGRGRRNDARPIRARSASHGSSTPPIAEHAEDSRNGGRLGLPSLQINVARQQVNQLNAGG